MTRTLTLLLALAGVFSTAQAQDAQRGATKVQMCIGCHGIVGYQADFPQVYKVPKIAGQDAKYIAAALTEYRSGDRLFPTMRSIASSLTDQDIADIAAYFAGKPLVSQGKPAAAPPAPAVLCVSCHGQDGVAIAPSYPSLAGQHEDYIARAIDEYRKGGRKNPIMKGFAATLKDEDIAAIAQFFSHEHSPSLSTESRPYTRLTAEPEHKE